jgi:hypothetical protein
MDLVFQDHPDVRIGTLTFRNVPTILQFDDTPLIEVRKSEPAGYTAHFHIFDSDGTDLAVVKGARLFPTEAGKKAGLTLRNPPNLTVCELAGKPLFELRRDGAAALKGWAELWTPTGLLIKAADSVASHMRQQGGWVQIGNLSVTGATFIGCDVAIHIQKDGQVKMLASPGRIEIA